MDHRNETPVDLYDKLSRYLVPEKLLERYGYPVRDPDNPQLRKVAPRQFGDRPQLRECFADSYKCERCSKQYRVDGDGIPTSTSGTCEFHHGHWWSMEGRYSCCMAGQPACDSNRYHVHEGELEMENYRGYVETRDKPEWDPNRHGVYALDCEMVYTTYGMSLIKVSVVNHKYELVYERLVKPKSPILDYNTRFTGLKQDDLYNVHTTLTDVQRDLLELFSSKTILIGHSLNHDMMALKLFHKCFIDTTHMFPHKRGLPFKRALKTLVQDNLGFTMRRDGCHDSKEDAIVAFRLVMSKAI